MLLEASDVLEVPDFGESILRHGAQSLAKAGCGANGFAAQCLYYSITRVIGGADISLWRIGAEVRAPDRQALRRLPHASVHGQRRRRADRRCRAVRTVRPMVLVCIPRSAHFISCRARLPLLAPPLHRISRTAGTAVDKCRSVSN